MHRQNTTHILIVEDNPGDVRITEIMLRDDPRMDYTFTACDSLRAAAEYLAGGKADIALLDLNLPDSSGLSTYTTLQENTPDLPIVVLSGNNDLDTATDAVRAGAQDYVVKGSVDSAALARIIRHAIERKQAEKSIALERDRARKYFDIAGAILLVLDQDGKVEKINQKGTDILGYQHQDEIIGLDWFTNFIPADQRDALRDAHQALISSTGNKSTNVESRIITHSGQQRLIVWHHTTIRDALNSGNSARLSTGEDITDRAALEEQRKILLELSREAASEMDFKKLLFFISEQVIKIIKPAQSTSIFLIDHERETAAIKAWAGFGNQDLSDLEIPLTDSVIQQLIATRSPVCMNSIDENPEFIFLENSQNVNIKSSIAAPIFFRNKGIDGILYCDNLEKERAFYDEDLAMLETVSNQVAGFIENARLLDKLNLQYRELQEERNHAQNYLDIAEVMIVALDEKGNITLANRKSCTILGYEEEELLGSNWFDLCVPPDDRERAWSLFADFLSSDEISGPDYEQAFCTKKGQERIAHWQSRKLFDENGKVRGSLSSGEDITRQKQAQETLRQYEHIVSSSSDMMALVNNEQTYLAANDTYAMAFGLSSEEIIGRNARDLFEAEFFNRVMKPHVDHCLSGVEVVFNEWVTLPNAKRRYMETHYYPYVGTDDEVAGIVVNRRDITEQHHILQALKENENQLGNIINNSTNMFYSHTPDHLLIYSSPQSESILGYTPQEMMINWMDLTTDNPINKEGILRTEKAISTGQVQPPYELELRAKNGRHVWVQVHEAPLLENGKVTAVVGSLTDISTRRRAELESQQSLAALKIANEDLRVSHNRIMGTMDSTIRTIAKTVEVRDPYTAGHHRRVAELSVRIAQEMELEDELIKAIELAAVIHDLGKIQVPAEILSKPGRLSEIEFGLIKTHPAVGYDLLKEIDFPWPLAEIIRQHHERMDGSGYPRGLKGNAISLESRIIGVADTVEAMSSHRPYRSALGIDRALEQITKDRGTLFDPLVVDACLRAFESGFQLSTS